MKEDANQNDLHPYKQNISSSSQLKSPYLDQYQRFFKGIIIQSNFLQALRMHGVYHQPQREQKEVIIIKQIKSSSSYEAVLMEVYFGPFTLTISLLNRQEPSLAHSCELIGNGSAGSIYQWNYAKQPPQAIKCSRCFGDNSLGKFLLISVVQEYCFLQICSILELGPRIGKFMGFDIICYKNCIEFAMEKCETIYNLLDYEKSLKQSLLKLHQLSIIHFDIKPSNIAYSPLLLKPVFLDFGLTRVIKEPLGLMKGLFFSGTVGFSSKQMEKAYFTKDKHMVDPYFNDVIGLQRTFEYMKKVNPQKYQLVAELGCPESYFHNCPQRMSEIKCLGINGANSGIDQIAKQQADLYDLNQHKEKQILLMRIFYQLFMLDSSIIQLKKTIISSQLPFHYQKITQFLLNIYPNPALRIFYNTHIENNAQYDSKRLYNHFQKHSIFEEQRQRNADFTHRTASILNYEISFFSNSLTRARSETQVFESLLKGKFGFFTQEEYYLHLIEFIALNHLERQSSINDKIRVCDIFLQQDMQATFGTLQSIHKTINSLIFLAIRPPLNSFSQYIYSMAFEQACILNILNNPSMARLINQIYVCKLKPYNKLVLFVEMDRCILWLKARIVFHNYLCWRSVKQAITTAVQGIIHKKGVRIAIKQYFKYEFLDNVDYQNFARLYQREVKEFFNVELNQRERKELRLNLLSKNILVCELLEIMALQKHFQAFQRLFYERNRGSFSSYQIIMVYYYDFTLNYPRLEKILAPLRARLKDNKQFDLFDFQLRIYMNHSLHTTQMIQKSTKYLLFVAGEAKRRGYNLPTPLFKYLFNTKHILFKLSKTNSKHIPLFDEACQCVSYHSYLFQKIILQFFQKNNFIQNHTNENKIKAFLLDLARDKHQQRMSSILNGILSTIQNDYIDTDLAIQLGAIRFLRTILASILVILYQESNDLESAEKLNLKIINSTKNIGSHKKKVLRMYSNLILLFENNTTKRAYYSNKLFQATKDQELLHFYFRHTKKWFIFYILEGILKDEKSQQQNRLDNVIRLVRILSQSVYVQYSVFNFVRLLASLRKFMQAYALHIPISSRSYLAKKFSTILSHNPLITVTLGLLLPYLQKGHKRPFLAKIAKAMPLLTEDARRAIHKPYIAAIIGEIKHGRAKRQAKISFNRLYNCSKLEKNTRKGFRKAQMWGMGLIKCRRYYNNFNSMEERSQ